MDTAPLTLVSFARPQSGVAVLDALSGIGYPARLMPPEQLPYGSLEVLSGAVVLLLGSTSCTRDQVLTAGRYLHKRPSLAMVVRGECDWDQELIDTCCDCAQWPCAGDELAFRLGRLYGTRAVLEGETVGVMDPALAETLAELNLIGRSPAFLSVMRGLSRLVRCDAPVLIEGETGTGKELVARAIHYLGPRAEGPFVPVNCGALPDHLVENELFGHERGAYTDARTHAPGAIGEAAGGTLFLDEVEALSPKAQAALLRFLQDREYRPLGGRRVRHADTRVIAASNADLRHLSERREFRPDLYFRLDILSLVLPALRDRVGDVEVLTDHFLDQYCRRYDLKPLALDRRCLALLRDYPWPGNVRELENLVHRQVLMAQGPRLFLDPGAARTGPNDLAPEIPALGPSFAAAKAQVIQSFERDYLTRLMDETKGNVTQAARRADKERRALGKLLKKYGIQAYARD